MIARMACLTCVFGLVLLAAAPSARADLIAGTSFEPAEGYIPADKDVRNYPYDPITEMTEPGDWGGNTFAGAKGGDAYTGTRAEGPGTAYAGDQFMVIQRSGADSDDDIIIRRKFPVQTGLLYCRWAFRINSTATQADYWQVNNNINFSLDRKIDSKDGSDGNIGTETARLELLEDGRIVVKQSSFGGDITLAKRWDGTTTDGSDPIASALNSWVKVEILADISAQRFWLFWNDEYLGTYRFRKDLTSSSGIRQVNMLRFQVPRLDYAARGERLCVDDIELRTAPPAALSACLLTATPGDMTVNADVGQPAVPSAIDYTLQNVGLSAINWTAATLDETMNPAIVPWLAISATGGSLASMDTATVTATVDTTGLSGGTHLAYVKFTDDCNPANEIIREVRLVVIGCTWTVSSCNEVRSYLLDYPDMPVADVVYRITNTGQQPMTYTVTQSGSSCVSGLWTLANGTGTINGGEFADVAAAFNREALVGQATDSSYTCDLLFADNCSAQTVGRTIRLRYRGQGNTHVFRYDGGINPLADGSAGEGLRFDLYKDSGLSPLGAVENDPDAYDGKVFRIQDDSMSKVKYRLSRNDGSGAVELSNEIGGTIVARVKVYHQFGSRSGGLFLWEEDGGTCTYHWGGFDGVIQETERGDAAIVSGTTDFVILRLTSIGRKDDPWDCSRIIRLYLDENPTPVLELVGADEETTLYEGLGFGAGSTSGEYDIAFDWVSGTDAGAFAPGEEEAVLGFSLVGQSCPVDWADFDGDHDVDQVDFGLWQHCFTRAGDPTGSFDSEACNCADGDRDGDVDIDDASAFIECATGPGIPFDTANPPAGCN